VSSELENWKRKKTQQTEPKSFAETKTNYACKAFFFPLSSVVSLSFSHDTAMAPSPHHNLTSFPRTTTLKTEYSKIIKKMERTKPSRERERELLPAVTLRLRTAGQSQMECIAAEEE
jgi:hypothetical protein